MARHKISIDITEAAADWLDQLAGEMTETQRQAFAHWLQRSPVHVEEFLQISELQREVSGALHRSPEWVTELIEQTPSNVVDLPPGLTVSDDADLPDSSEQSHHRLGWMAIAAVLVGMVATAWMIQTPDEPVRFTTTLGEQRTVTLSDDSTLTLNTDSAVEITMTNTTRELTLIRGELLVDVVKDASRPFRVLSGDAVIEAIGTSFTVHRRQDATVVTVVEGVVRLARIGGSITSQSGTPVGNAAPVELRAGSKATLVRDDVEDPVKLEPVNVERATAWVGRRLDFDAETVATVVEEFNRYNRTTLKVEDPYLASRRISGVFNVNNPDAFVDLLAELEPITVEQQREGYRLLRRKTE